MTAIIPADNDQLELFDAVKLRIVPELSGVRRETCEACGGDTIRSEYHATMILGTPCGEFYGVWTQNGRPPFPAHLCRTCAYCRFGWMENFNATVAT